ncbi:hypothetical protein ACFE04_002428 [Oxalis oulophora]
MIKSKLEVEVSLAKYIEAIKDDEEEEPVVFGPNVALMDFGIGRKLQIVAELDHPDIFRKQEGDEPIKTSISPGMVYLETVEPIVPIILQHTDGTCFAYGNLFSSAPKELALHIYDYDVYLILDAYMEGLDSNLCLTWMNFKELQHFQHFVPLWPDYLNFIQEYDTSVSNCTRDGIAKARSLFECAITAGSVVASAAGGGGGGGKGTSDSEFRPFFSLLVLTNCYNLFLGLDYRH